MCFFKKIKEFFSRNKVTIEIESTNDIIEENPIQEEYDDSITEVDKLEDGREFIAEDTEIVTEYIAFDSKDKEYLCNIMRPIVKSYNNEKKDIYLQYVDENNIRTIKTYCNIVDDDTLLIFKFTQSDKYNDSINEFVKENIFNQFVASIDVSEYDIEVEDGKIKMRKIKKMNFIKE